MLFTAVQRQMGRDTILIVDALNYIKGFRYQLYCAAREFKLRVCTVGVLSLPGETSGTDTTRVGLCCCYARTMQALEYREV
jgi:protein KTI12